MLVLTKPIGTQIAVNAYQWLDKPDMWSRVSGVVTQSDVRVAYKRAMASMSRLNRTGNFSAIAADHDHVVSFDKYLMSCENALSSGRYDMMRYCMRTYINTHPKARD